MTLAEQNSWNGRESELPTGRDLAYFEHELALVDRIIGLEAEVAELSQEASLRPEEHLGVEQQLARVRRSLTWRAGRVVSAPLRIARKATGR